MNTTTISIPRGKRVPPLHVVEPTRSNLCEWLKATAYVLAPDIRAAGVYIEPDEELFGGGPAIGLTSPTMSIALRPMLELAGKWRGPRPAVALNVVRIFRNAINGGRGETMGKVELLATCLHELAHVLSELRPGGKGLVRKSELPPDVLRELAIECMAPTEPENRLDGPGRPNVPFVGHGANWLRTLLHLRYRAKRAVGIAVPLEALCDSANYRIARLELYKAALGDEPKRCRHMSFRQILASPPPMTFAALWRDDVLAAIQRTLGDLPHDDAVELAAAYHEIDHGVFC